MKLHFIFVVILLIREELDRLLCDAKSNAELKEKLLKTEQSENPIDNFCFLCRSLGYKISAGELFCTRT